MGEYKLGDETYYALLMKLKKNKFANLNVGLKKNIVAYYKKRDASLDYQGHSYKGKKITYVLEQLNSAKATHLGLQED